MLAHIFIRNDLQFLPLILRSMSKDGLDTGAFRDTVACSCQRERVLTWGQALSIENFSCSTQLSMKLILLINVETPTIANNCWRFNIYEQDDYNT